MWINSLSKKTGQLSRNSLLWTPCDSTQKACVKSAQWCAWMSHNVSKADWGQHGPLPSMWQEEYIISNIGCIELYKFGSTGIE